MPTEVKADRLITNAGGAGPGWVERHRPAPVDASMTRRQQGFRLLRPDAACRPCRPFRRSLPVQIRNQPDPERIYIFIGRLHRFMVKVPALGSNRRARPRSHRLVRVLETAAAEFGIGLVLRHTMSLKSRSQILHLLAPTRKNDVVVGADPRMVPFGLNTRRAAKPGAGRGVSLEALRRSTHRPPHRPWTGRRCRSPLSWRLPGIGENDIDGSVREAGSSPPRSRP